MFKTIFVFISVRDTIILCFESFKISKYHTSPKQWRFFFPLEEIFLRKTFFFAGESLSIVQSSEKETRLLGRLKEHT